MRTIWVVLGVALCGFAVAGTGVDPVARWAALFVAAGAVFRCSARSLVVLAFALGFVSGQRVGTVASVVQDPSAEIPVAIELIETTQRGRARGWVRLPDGVVLRARVRGLDDHQLNAGSRVVARARVQDLRRRSTPDRRHAGRGARARRDEVGVVVREVLASQPIDGTPRVARWREEWAGALAGRLGVNAGLWRALILADGAALDPDARIAVQSLGMAHLLALSGMHTSIVAAALLWPWRRRGRRVLIWAIPVLAGWALLAGGGASLVRAVGMATWWVVARRRARRSTVEDSIAAVALMELVLRPHLLCGIGWWLSYVATLAVVKSARRVGAWPRPVAAVAISVSAQCATLPWVIDAFGLVNVVAPVTLLLVGPLFALCLIGGFVALALGSLVPPIAPWTDPLAVGCGHVFGLSLEIISSTKMLALRAPGLDGLAWTAAVSAVGVALWPAPLTLRVRAGVAGLLAAVVLSGGTPDHEWILFDAGQGDAAVFRCGPSALVIDAGPRYEGRSPAGWTVVDWLERRGFEDVTVALTHGHADHIGGLAEMLASGRVGEIAVARSDSGRAWVHRLFQAGTIRAVQLRLVQPGEHIDLGHCRVEVLWPPAGEGGLHSNDRSLVLGWEGPGGRVIAAGDLEREGESQLLERGRVRAHPWLKVAHHGGDTGTDAGWLETLGVRDAFVSCGAGNRYGHPDPAVLERLRGAGVRVHRTDQCGFVRLRWSGTSGEGTLDCGRDGCP